MGLIISLLIIPVVNRLFKLNREIKARWFTYLIALTRLLRQRKQNQTNRVITHDIHKENLRDAGVLPFPHEWMYDCPHQTKNEDLLIYGVNSSKQSFKVSIKWRANCEAKSATVSLRFDDSDGNYYTLDEVSKVERRDKEYRCSGLALEIMAPFRRKRITFRGYLNKNGQQLVYVKFRFLWSASSRVYDFTHDFDDYFMAKEWTICQRMQYEQEYEDRFEQFGQFKGTFIEEENPERVLFFWGSISKRYLELKPINRRIIRIVGYNKQGIGFDLGFHSNNNSFEYRFGFLFEKVKGFKKLKNISLQKLDFERLLSKDHNISFKALFGETNYEFEIKEKKNSLAKDLIINGNPGMCYIFEDKQNEFQESIQSYEKLSRDSSLVLGLNDENAKCVDLTGGKGSSLAVLMALSQQLVEDLNENNFNVANGVVVTTKAYQRLLEEYEDIEKDIEKFEMSTDIPNDSLKNKCHNLVNSISNYKIPEIIAKEIDKKLKQSFNDYENKLFAVRSSGASEDSEEMSAAGQMTTYLGVKGLENIKQSVMKCWSSQFSYIAVEYKKSYGQPINSPMAVVIQEMVGCESAGVMFTCDPITGDERVIEITGNYGLGESVVSASSEPDTIRLSVNIESNSLSKRRTVSGITSKVIGAKKTLIKLSESGGTVEEEVFDKEKCCISDDDLFRLGDLGLKIHTYYGNARDIEWGLKGGQIFMLQSRPVTNLDNSYTEYEIMHELDTPHLTEFDIYSRAHWGENYPGSSSWVALSWSWAHKSGFFRMVMKDQGLTLEDYNPFTVGMGIQYNQLMFNLSNGFFDLFSDYPESEFATQTILAFFGHHIKDEDVLSLFKERRIEKKKPSLLMRIKMIFGLIYILIFGPKNLIQTKAKYIDELKYNMVDKIKDRKTARDIFNGIISEYAQLNEVQFKNHGPTLIGSTIKHLLLWNTLKGAQKNNPNLEEDFNFLISSCEEVISAEVPNNLRDIAKAIEDKKQFIELSDEEALQMLRNGTNEASLKFKQFLERHGHRGYREFDPMCLTWADNPIPCIKNIKAILLGNESQLVPKTVKSVDEVMSELKIPLNFIRKLLISKLLLPWSRSGVGYREQSKYFLIWILDTQRKAFRFLAKQMVIEGLIPTIDTFFYLTLDEIDYLCDGQRDPILNMKARLRKRIYPKMNKYKFEEFIKGPEMKPRNFGEQIIPTNSTNYLLQMKGTPVSSGAVKARVCVAEDITDADSIQSGDILITYSTDIGWSPYFPLLSGIVTEIGGTISHGAVIAREYGIPSLIAVEGVCRAFKTGDMCVLDTKSATITKLQ